MILAVIRKSTGLRQQRIGRAVDAVDLEAAVQSHRHLAEFGVLEGLGR